MSIEPEAVDSEYPWKKKAPTITTAGLRAGEFSDTAERAYWRSVRILEGLVGGVSEFDRRTFGANDQRLSTTVRRLTHWLRDDQAPICDLLLQLTPFLENAFAEIERNPRTKLARRYEEMPLHKIRNQDTRCLMKMARRPGRTVVEKTARTRKAPAVVRYESVDTSENRLVRRLAGELFRALEARGEREESAGRKEQWDQSAEDLLKLCRRILRESPLGELRPEIATAPNNVLLGDPAYNTVFRAFRNFRRRQEDFERLWRGGLEAVPRAIAWALRAELAALDEVVATEAVLAPRRPGTNPAGDNVHAVSSTSLFEPVAGECWFFAVDSESAAFRVNVESGAVVVRRWSLVGDYLLTSDEPDETWKILVEPGDVSQRGDQNGERGYPLDFFCEVSAKDELHVSETYADRLGYLEAAQWALKLAGFNSRPKTSESGDNDADAHQYQRLGVSFDRAHVRTAVGSEVEMGNLLLAAGKRDVENGHILTGRPAARTLTSDDKQWRRESFRRVWQQSVSNDDSDNETSADDAAVEQDHENDRDWLKSLRTAAEEALDDRLGIAADLAVTTPDGLDELQLQKFRELLPVTGGEQWLVWRSVAAALAWREADENNVEVGDVVVVIDTDAPRCTATMLVGRREEEEADGATDDWYWERPAPFAMEEPSGATKLDYEESLAWAMTARLSDELLREDVAKRLVEEGCLETLEVGDTVELPLFHHGNPALVRLRLDEEHLGVARETWRENFNDWVKDFAGQGHDELIRGRVRREGGTLHLLPVGKVFEEEGCFSQLCEQFDELFDDIAIYRPSGAGDMALRGTSIFLQRHAESLPTWRDLIPDLKLMVGDARNKQEIDLLDPEAIRHGVRPGQLLSYEPTQQFELPAGATLIDFPMRSGVDEEGRGGDEYTALLRDTALPLQASQLVRLRVAYRYAEDAFRIFVSPVDTPEAKVPPFDEIQVEWRRGDDDSGEDHRDIQNEPPEFPEANRWEPNDDWYWRFEALQGEREEAEEKIKPFLNKSGLHSRLRSAPGEVRSELKELTYLVEDIEKWTGYVIPIGRTLDEPPEEVRRELQQVREVLAALADVPTDGDKWSFPHKKLKKCKDSSVQKARAKLHKRALRSMGKLRHLSPPELLQVIRDEFESGNAPDDQVQMRFETYGRALGDLRDEERRSYLTWLLESLNRFADEKLAQDVPDSTFRHYLWALATGLWSNREAIHQLGKEQADRLCTLLLELARQIEAEWIDEGVCIEIFKELGLVTLALLRLRGGPMGQRVEASNEFCEELAQLMESIDEATGFEANARIDVEGELDAFGTLVAENLRGYRISRIQIIEE